MLDKSPISDVIELHPEDHIIYVGMDAKTHRTERPDGTFPYPDNGYILSQLGQVSTLRVGGFHLWDCVSKLAESAYQKGYKVLIDEDLTKLLSLYVGKENFKKDSYPNFDPREEFADDEVGFKIYMERRRDKPWIWQYT